MDIKHTLVQAVNNSASDIFIIAGKPLSFKINGRIVSEGEKLTPSDTEELVKEIYRFDSRNFTILEDRLDDDFSFSFANLGRFRVNAFKQRGSVAAVLKVVLFQLPSPSDLRIPPQVIDLYKSNQGLILVTGPTGCGKSTTLACLIDQINKSREAHIITLEDPIEFLHKHDKSIVSQREISMDTHSYERGLRAALREAPNVILLGEMRDFETISTAMSAAETGQLVFSTLHTLGAANTIDRIVDAFPANQQMQVRVQLAMVLQAVVSQQLIPSTIGTLVPAFEIMLCNNAIRTMIRESKVHQLDSVIYESSDSGMISMDNSINKLYQEGLITAENALMHCVNHSAMRKKIK